MNKIRDDIPGINAVLRALARWDVSTFSDVPEGAMQASVDTGNRITFKRLVGGAWVAVARLMHDVDTVDGFHASAGATPNALAVRDKNGRLPGDITGNAATAGEASGLAAGYVVDIAHGGHGGKTSAEARKNLGCNNADNINTGLLGAPYGGTGRPDGMVEDVYLPALGKSATQLGQLGSAAPFGARDLNSMVTDGRYRVTATGQINGPLIGAGVLNVSASDDGYISHLYVSDASGATASRSRPGLAAAWTPWLVNRVYTGAVNIYVAKDGNDANDGLSPDTAVQTVNRALDIMTNLQVSRNASVYLRFGPGDWGNVDIVLSLSNITYLRITSITNTVGTTNNLGELPFFARIRTMQGRFQVFNVVSNEIMSLEGSMLNLAGYIRCAYFSANNGGYMGFAGDTTYDIVNNSRAAVFYADYMGRISSPSVNTVFNFVEECTYSIATVTAYYGGLISIRASSGYSSFTGSVPTKNKRFAVEAYGQIITWGAYGINKFFPGDGTYQITTGGRYNGEDGGVSAGFVAGTRMLFQQAAAPTGWVKETSAAYNDAALRVVTGSAVATGGTDAFSAVFGAARTTSNTSAGGTVGATTLTVAQITEHDHTYPSSSVTRAAGSGDGFSPNGTMNTSKTGGSQSHTHTITPTAHTHTLTLNVKRVDLIICTKQ